jgi:hypothetical protein
MGSAERNAHMLQAEVTGEPTAISRNGKPAKKPPQSPLPVKRPAPKAPPK